MRVPHLVVMRRHSVAALTVSFGRIWHTCDVDDLILGYNACGRLARVVFLDPRRALPSTPEVADAVRAALSILSAYQDARPEDLDVLRSALRRTPAYATDVGSDIAGQTG